MTDRPPPADYKPWPAETRHTPTMHRGWSILAISLTVFLVVAGLAAVGAFVLFFFAMSNYGSNK